MLNELTTIIIIKIYPLVWNWVCVFRESREWNRKRRVPQQSTAFQRAGTENGCGQAAGKWLICTQLTKIPPGQRTPEASEDRMLTSPDRAFRPTAPSGRRAKFMGEPAAIRLSSITKTGSSSASCPRVLCSLCEIELLICASEKSSLVVSSYLHLNSSSTQHGSVFGEAKNGEDFRGKR